MLAVTSSSHLPLWFVRKAEVEKLTNEIIGKLQLTTEEFDSTSNPENRVFKTDLGYCVVCYVEQPQSTYWVITIGSNKARRTFNDLFDVVKYLLQI